MEIKCNKKWWEQAKEGEKYDTIEYCSSSTTSFLGYMSYQVKTAEGNAL